MKKIVWAAILVYFISVGLTVLGLRLKENKVIFLDPFVEQNGSEEVLAASTTPKKIFGFLPFWTMKDVNPETYKDVDVVYYFSLTVKADGSFDKTDPGWNKLKDFPEVGKRQGLTIACMKQDDIVAVINNQTRQKKVIADTISLMEKYGLTDLNVDFEYVGAPPANLVANYTRFIKDFTEAIHKNNGEVSVATLSDAVWKSRMYDISEIGRVANYVIVMAYDFTRLSSAQSGPVAPLFGKEKFEYDVYSTITDYMKTMPAEKLVMGVPFYGYEWPTQDNKPYAFTVGNNSALSTVKRTAETIKTKNATVMFDDLSKTPWFAYSDNGRWRQVWFENERSIGLKMDLVNQAELGGMAIWALGYEGNNSNLWGVIKDKIL